MHETAEDPRWDALSPSLTSPLPPHLLVGTGGASTAGVKCGRYGAAGDRRQSLDKGMGVRCTSTTVLLLLFARHPVPALNRALENGVFIDSNTTVQPVHGKIF